MSMAYIRKYYKVPAKRGGRVRYTGRDKPILGTIRAARHGYLRIQLDGEAYAGIFHPTWELEYITPTEIKKRGKQ